MKLCKDCKYISNIQDGFYGFARCNAPQNDLEIDPVTGDKKVHWTYCETHRSHNWLYSVLFHSCGKSGRWFTLKEKK